MAITLAALPTAEVQSTRLSLLLAAESCLCGLRFEVIRADWPDAAFPLAIVCPECREVVSEAHTAEALASDFYDSVYLINATHLDLPIPF